MEASERYVDPDVDVLRRPLTRAHQAIEGGEERGVATLVDEEIEEPVVVSATEQLKGEERSEPYLEIYARREGEDRFVTSIEILHRFDRTWEFLVCPIALSRRLPTIRIPLLPGDPEVPLNLQSVFQRAYDAGPYRRAVRFGEDPIDLPLPPAQATWAIEVLAKASAPRPNS